MSCHVNISVITGAVADPGYFGRPYIRWWMKPEELSVLVRRVGSVLEIRLVCDVERLTFELLRNDRHPDTALVSCDGTEKLTEVIDNNDGSKSILVIPGTQCEVTLEI